MRDPSPFQFGISSLLLITTLVAAIMSASVTVPSVGVFLAIVSMPALIPTYGFVRRRCGEGKCVSNREKVVVFLLFSGVAALAGLAAFGAGILVTYLAIAFVTNDSSIAIWMLVGGGVSLTLLVFLLRWHFRRLSDKPTPVQKESAPPMDQPQADSKP